MKLRNKKTGEVKSFIMVTVNGYAGNGTLAEINEEWEDFLGHWYLDSDGEIICEPAENKSSFDNDCEQIGNYFETKEQAEKAVEKLKAWKRLKDKGFRFTAWKNGILLDETVAGQVRYEFPIGNKDDVEQDLDLLFGGEE